MTQAVGRMEKGGPSMSFRSSPKRNWIRAATHTHTRHTRLHRLGPMADTQVNNSNGPRQAGLLFRLDTSGRADSIQTLSRVTFISSTRHFKVSNTQQQQQQQRKKSAVSLIVPFKIEKRRVWRATQNGGATTTLLSRALPYYPHDRPRVLNEQGRHFIQHKIACSLFCFCFHSKSDTVWPVGRCRFTTRHKQTRETGSRERERKKSTKWK